MSNTLVLLTSAFPYGKSETFLENELLYLADAFHQVYVVALNTTNTIREVPANVTVLSIQKDFEQGYTAAKSVKYLNSITLQTFVQEYRNGSGKVNSKSELLSYMLRINYKASLLQALLYKHNIPAGAVFYSYWFEEWATILAILQKKKIIKNFISRAHGYDLYEERNTNQYIRFRELQLAAVTKVWSISADGLAYLKAKYPQHAQKFGLSYLGVHDHSIGPVPDAEDIYTLVSCSNVVSVKRVHLIVEALHYISFPIKWMHFGDGPQVNQVTEACAALPANVTVELRGRITNSDLMHFYQTTSVSLFINVSESEGLPVSIMEAASFGIPILATDVGGTNEIVNDKTGVLVAATVSPSQIAAQITKSYHAINKHEFISRSEIKEFWAKNFDAAVNFPEFASKLKANE